ncbi:tyrosine-type recombinase/integrase [Winogradskyella tangerina]|uniref:tyrosine-type recombinase/integrase n=1 Tax=Winogradskyella tangerina TaxID=2023240 RepID=UPI0018E59846|nr:tyrosine-type recombinase/integrase [Winogradskyella tangerina]
MKLKQNFSLPKIYTANGNINKRWYVYFSFRNPETGKMKRMTPFYGIANKFKTKEERMEVLTVYRKSLIKLLKLGFNPFEDNTKLFEKLNNPKKNFNDQSKKKSEKNLEVSKPEPFDVADKVLIKDVLFMGLKLKEKVVKERTYRDYKININAFSKWLSVNHPNVQTIDHLKKAHFTGFLNSILEKSSARNRNNYRTNISSILQVLVDNDIIERNFLKSIPKLKTKPERHKRFSSETELKIFEHLKKVDPILLLFIKFYSYAFMRPQEVCRIRINDINIKEKTVSFIAKNGKLKTKIIPSILYDELPDLSDYHPENLLFTPNKIGGNWNAKELSRRDHFSKRFRKTVKEHFNLGIDYGLYSFRHTYITKLYRALNSQYSSFEAKSRLMSITGHESMAALEKYLRDIDADLPDDYSDMLKNK